MRFNLNYRVPRTITAAIFFQRIILSVHLSLRMNVKLDFICIGPVDLPGARRKRQNTKWKMLAQSGTRTYNIEIYSLMCHWIKWTVHITSCATSMMQCSVHFFGIYLVCLQYDITGLNTPKASDFYSVLYSDTAYHMILLILLILLILIVVQSDFPQISWPWYRVWPSPIMSGFHGTFATGVACQQGTLTLPDTWFRPLLWDLLVLQLLRPDSSNLPCLYSTFHLEYPLVLSRFCFIHRKKYHSQFHFASTYFGFILVSIKF